MWFADLIGLNDDVSEWLSKAFEDAGIDDVSFLREWMEGINNEEDQMDNLFQIVQQSERDVEGGNFSEVMEMKDGFALRILWALEKGKLKQKSNHQERGHEGLTSRKRGW